MIKKVLLLVAIWFSLCLETLASQQKITGSYLANLIFERLKKEGLSSQPVIEKGRVFFGCAGDNVVIRQRHNSWKTVKLTCLTNKSWDYTFRTKLAESIEIVKTDKPHDILKESALKKTQPVFVLNRSKKKGRKS